MFDEKLYQETFSQVRASEETLSEVLNMTKRNKRYSGVRVTRILVAAVIAAATLATTAFAYVGFMRYENPMQMLESFLGAEEYILQDDRTFTYHDAYGNKVVGDLPDVEKIPLDEQVAEEDVAPYVSDVGKSITCEDYTLTVEAHLYDSATNCGIIYYSIENPNGVKGYEVFDDGSFWWPGGEMVFISNVGNGKGSYVVEDETTDTKLSVAFYYCGADDLDFICAAFYADKSNALILPLNDGGGMNSICLANGDIILSPISLRLNTEKMDYLYDEEGFYDHIERLVLRYKDGSEYVIYSDEPYIDNSTYSCQNYEGTVTSYTFNRLVNLDEVEAVIINDVEYTDIQALTVQQRDNLSGYEGPDLSVATEPENP